MVSRALNAANNLEQSRGREAPVLRAWDKKTGAVVAEIQLPGATTGFPVTYTKAGQQYIAVAVRAGDAVDIVALGLPTATGTGRGGRGGGGAGGGGPPGERAAAENSNQVHAVPAATL